MSVIKVEKVIATTYFSPNEKEVLKPKKYTIKNIILVEKDTESYLIQFFILSLKSTVDTFLMNIIKSKIVSIDSVITEM